MSLEIRPGAGKGLGLMFVGVVFETQGLKKEIFWIYETWALAAGG